MQNSKFRRGQCPHWPVVRYPLRGYFQISTTPVRGSTTHGPSNVRAWGVHRGGALARGSATTQRPPMTASLVPFLPAQERNAPGRDRKFVPRNVQQPNAAILRAATACPYIPASTSFSRRKSLKRTETPKFMVEKAEQMWYSTIVSIWGYCAHAVQSVPRRRNYASYHCRRR